MLVSADRMGATAIDALGASGYRIVEVWTSGADEPVGSLRRLFSASQRSAARVLAKAAAPHRRIERPWSVELDRALVAAPPFDVLVCAGSSIIFPVAFLDRLKGRAVNLHPALLPHYRGPLPLHAMVIDGMADLHGGMTLHVLSKEIDGGAIIGQRRVSLRDHDSVDHWQQAVMDAMRPLLADDLRNYLAGRLEPVPQPHGAGSYHAARDVPLYAAPDQTLERITRYLAVAPTIQRNTLVIILHAGRTRRFVVTGGPEVLGTATGAAPVIGLRRIEFDTLDARIRLRRLTRPERLLRKVWRRLSVALGR